MCLYGTRFGVRWKLFLRTLRESEAQRILVRSRQDLGCGEIFWTVPIGENPLFGQICTLGLLDLVGCWFFIQLSKSGSSEFKPFWQNLQQQTSFDTAVAMALPLDSVPAISDWNQEALVTFLLDACADPFAKQAQVWFVIYCIYCWCLMKASPRNKMKKKKKNLRRLLVLRLTLTHQTTSRAQGSPWNIGSVTTRQLFLDWHGWVYNWEYLGSWKGTVTHPAEAEIHQPRYEIKLSELSRLKQLWRWSLSGYSTNVQNTAVNFAWGLSRKCHSHSNRNRVCSWKGFFGLLIARSIQPVSCCGTVLYLDL